MPNMYGWLRRFYVRIRCDHTQYLRIYNLLLKFFSLHINAILVVFIPTLIIIIANLLLIWTIRRRYVFVVYGNNNNKVEL